MANGTLSFTLPEEQTEFERACKAGDIYCVLNHFDNELRSHLRHNTHPDWDGRTVEEIRKILWDLVADYGIQID
jgi:hypothetical protein